MAFTLMYTDYGLQRWSEANMTGVPINFAGMVYGDGGGVAVEPSPAQTQLVREIYRGPINALYQSAADPQVFVAEGVIPVSVGGFVLREFGIVDDLGGMVFVGSTPEIQKTTESEGAFGDTLLKAPFKSSNAAIITLIADPNVVMASRSWVLQAIDVCHLMPGGTAGQVWKKLSNACGDAGWGDPDTANVVVDVIEERQTLSAGQTSVTLSVVTTRGLAVYIDGVRLPHAAGADGWQESVAAPDTTIVLGQSYPAGTKVLLLQNEPAGAVPFPLVRDKSLADVPDKAAGRASLDVYSTAETRQMAPAGLVATFARSTAPTGWLKANGAAVSRTAYADLFAAIGTMFGAGDGINTFNLPDVRGEFPRFLDDGRGVDAGRTLGSPQSGMIAAHTHTAAAASAGSHSHTATVSSGGSHSHTAKAEAVPDHTHGLNAPDGGSSATAYELYQSQVNNNDELNGYQTGAAGGHSHSIAVSTAGQHAHTATVSAAVDHTHAVTVSSSGGTETRPRNIAFLGCIKY